MKFIFSILSKLIIQILLIPLILLLSLVLILVLVLMIPINVFRQFVLGVIELVAALFHNEEYEGLAFTTLKDYIAIYTSVLGTVFTIPSMVWKGEFSTARDAISIFEMERWIWFRNWYVTLAVLLFFGYCSYSIGNTTYRISRESNQNQLKIEELRLDEYVRVNSLQTDSIEMLTYERDSLQQLVQQITLNIDSLAQKIIDGIGGDREDELEVVPINNDTQPDGSPEEVEIQEKGQTIKRQIDANDEVPQDVVSSNEDYKPNYGVVCVKLYGGCSFTDVDISINGQFVSTTKMWNPNGEKACGERGTFRRRLDPGKYSIVISSPFGEERHSFELSEGEVEVYNVKCREE